MGGGSKGPGVGWKRSERASWTITPTTEQVEERTTTAWCSPSEHMSRYSLGDIVHGDHVKGSEWGISWEAATMEGSIRELRQAGGKVMG